MLHLYTFCVAQPEADLVNGECSPTDTECFCDDHSFVKVRKP